MKIKLDLLNEDDIKNIQARKKAFKLINEQVDDFSNKVENEIFNKIEKDGFIIEELNNSEKKLQKLRYQYMKCENSMNYLVMCLASLLLSLCLVVSYVTNKNLEILSKDILFLCFLLIFSICGLPVSIKGVIARKRIKRNFKNMGLPLF